jgi:hypothetical protein
MNIGAMSFGLRFRATLLLFSALGMATAFSLGPANGVTDNSILIGFCPALDGPVRGRPHRGFVDAMVLVERLRRAGKERRREKFIAGVESIHEMNVGLGSKLILAYGPADHKGFDSVYPTIVKGGQSVLLTDWSGLAK